MNFKYSLILPVYNVEKYIKVCLDSILSQNMNNYEIILVDDGSKDSSGLICDEYKNKYPDIVKVIHVPNSGVFAARHTGLKIATGEYVWFVDSDDFIKENSLSLIDETISKYKPDILLFNYRGVDEEGNEISSFTINNIFVEGYVTKEQLYTAYAKGIYNNIYVKIFKRSIIDLNFDYSPYNSIVMGDDLFDSALFSSKAESAYYINEQFYCYRQQSSSITHNFNNAQYLMLQLVLPFVKEKIIELNIDFDSIKPLYDDHVLDDLWYELKFASLSNLSKDEYNKVLDRLYNIDLVQSSKDLKYHDTTIKRKVKAFIIKCFFKQKYKLVRKYICLINNVSRSFSRNK